MSKVRASPRTALPNCTRTYRIRRSSTKRGSASSSDSCVQDVIRKGEIKSRTVPVTLKSFSKLEGLSLQNCKRGHHHERRCRIAQELIEYAGPLLTPHRGCHPHG